MLRQVPLGREIQRPVQRMLTLPFEAIHDDDAPVDNMQHISTMEHIGPLYPPAKKPPILPLQRRIELDIQRLRPAESSERRRLASAVNTYGVVGNCRTEVLSPE